MTSPRISVSHLWAVYPPYTDSAGNAVMEMSQEASSEGGAAVRRRRSALSYIDHCLRTVISDVCRDRQLLWVVADLLTMRYSCA